MTTDHRQPPAPTADDRLDDELPQGLGLGAARLLERGHPPPAGVPRNPDLLIFATIQPIMFVLLFNYVFGGSI